MLSLILGATTHDLLGDSPGQTVLVPQLPVEIRLSGTSSLRDWSCRTTSVEGALLSGISESDLRNNVSNYLNSDDQDWDGDQVPEMEVWLEIDPHSLDCDNARMQRDLLRAINAEYHPYIRFWFNRLVGIPEWQHDENGTQLILGVEGRLTLAGVTRTVEHQSRIQMSDPNHMHVSGELHLDMRDFSIRPPTALLGLLRAHPELTVSYRFVVPLDHNPAFASQAIRRADSIRNESGIDP